eukprot:TRINITY_DN57915_c0_g1_i1.p1 TRINITY_DN57915_c0_g1~~TRINITY_DN57915_c0_g1_i1.p1  ORF type:complete len:227 (+),score=40.24 TRINITY_DN57915_c0_g1_i1:87-767(+)
MATPGQLQMYNKLETSEMFGLDHRARDERTGQIHRVHIHEDSKVPDAIIYTIWLEDHTLGNALRMELLRNESVLFAGYKVPHPYNHMIELRVQTLPKTSPEAAVRLAIKNLKTECRSILDQFDEGVAQYQENEAETRRKMNAVSSDVAGIVSSRPEALGDRAGFSSDAGYSPSDGDQAPLGFQESLANLEQAQGDRAGSFSPSYCPTSPGGGGGDGGDQDEEMPPA